MNQTININHKFDIELINTICKIEEPTYKETV